METRSNPYAARTDALAQASFFPKVYGWMAVGLLVSAVAAMALLGSPDAMRFVFGSRLVFFGLILGELGLVFYLSARVMSMSAAAAKGAFVAFAALNGVTLASIFLVYTASSIASAYCRRVSSIEIRFWSMSARSCFPVRSERPLYCEGGTYE